MRRTVLSDIGESIILKKLQVLSTLPRMINKIFLRIDLSKAGINVTNEDSSLSPFKVDLHALNSGVEFPTSNGQVEIDISDFIHFSYSPEIINT